MQIHGTAATGLALRLEWYFLDDEVPFLMQITQHNLPPLTSLPAKNAFARLQIIQALLKRCPLLKGQLLGLVL